MNKHTPYIILDCVLAGLFLIGIIYMYEVKMAPNAGMAGQAGVQSEESASQSSVQPLTLLFATNDAERELGLGQRASLPSDEGMLFVFDTPAEYSFWMKDMSFPIDMIWMDANFRITYIAANVSPSTYPETFTPPAPSLYVLETNAGYAQKNNLSAGETLDFISPQLEQSQQSAQ